MRAQRLVRDFHEKFGLMAAQRPQFPDAATIELRQSLIEEETAEFRKACTARDLVEAADALADLLYVVHGAAVSFGIDLEPIFEEVHRTNMAKSGGPRRGDGKILKPAGWQPPQIRPLLEQQGAVWSD